MLFPMLNYFKTMVPLSSFPRGKRGMTTPEVGPDILEAGKTHKRTELSR